MATIADRSEWGRLMSCLMGHRVPGKKVGADLGCREDDPPSPIFGNHCTERVTDFTEHLPDGKHYKTQLRKEDI